ncbi:MAG: N-acyl homoserine lactonase family protein [Acidobacteria bacterium]|nr:N-acyl homoserine lactonase family protein [Acidobacteriota bacterium]
MISPVLLSEVVLPEDHPRAGSACMVFGFVVHHSEGPVLVDTGVGVGNRNIDSAFSPVHHSVDGALARIGVDRYDVRMVINSHLHFDHCGNNGLFPGIAHVVQRAEYDQVHQEGYTISEWVDFRGSEWELVDGEVEVLPGIRVMPTPGHTPGHQSVVVTHSEGVDVIAAQAVYDPDEFETEASTEPLTDAEAKATSESARRIKAVGPIRVFFSHDPRVWLRRGKRGDWPHPGSSN